MGNNVMKIGLETVKEFLKQLGGELFIIHYPLWFLLEEQLRQRFVY